MIYCIPEGGLNDCFNQLWICIEYAKKENREIIFEMSLYAASNLEDIFDFSFFPVKIHLKIQKESLFDLKTEPPDFWLDPHKLVTFNLEKSYDKDTLLIYHKGGGGHRAVNVFKHIQFTDYFIQLLNKENEKLPKYYYGIHYRATDYEWDGYIKELLYDEIENTIKTNPHKMIYLSSDNKTYLNDISRKFVNVIKSSSCDDLPDEYTSLHSFGKQNGQILERTLIDLCILADSEKYFPSKGGYTNLIKHLNEEKAILNKALRKNISS